MVNAVEKVGQYVLEGGQPGGFFVAWRPRLCFARLLPLVKSVLSSEQQLQQLADWRACQPLFGALFVEVLTQHTLQLLLVAALKL